LFGKLHLIRALFDVNAIQTLDVALVEDGFHWFHRLKLRLQLIDKIAFKHPGVKGSFIGIVFEDVPRSEHQIVYGRQRNEIAQQRRAVVGSLAQSNSPHLCQRADGFGNTSLDGFDPGNKGGAHRAQSD